MSTVQRLVCLMMLLGMPGAWASDEPVPDLELIAHGVIPLARIEQVRTALEEGSAAIRDILGLDGLPPIRVRVWQDRAEFAASLDDVDPGRGDRALGYIADEGDARSIRLFDDGGDLGQRAVYELAHIASLELNPGLTQDARWLWEAFALYQSRRLHPPTALSCITLSTAPALESLNEGNVIYRVGYLLTEFIVAHYGSAGLVSLIENGGDPLAALGESRADFHRLWHDYVVVHYLENRLPAILTESQIRDQVIGNTFYLPDGRDLYFAPNHTVYMEMGNLVQSGRWYFRDGTKMCWQVLNFEEFCATFRRRGDSFWLDTPPDCNRYALRRVEGNAEGY